MKKKWITEYDKLVDILHINLKDYTEIYNCKGSIARDLPGDDRISIFVPDPWDGEGDPPVVGLMITEFSTLSGVGPCVNKVVQPEDPIEYLEERLEDPSKITTIVSAAGHSRQPRSLTKLRVEDIVKIKFKDDSLVSIFAGVDDVNLIDFEEELKVSKIDWFDEKDKRLEGYEELDHIFVFNVKDNPHLGSDLRIPNDLLDELDIEIIEEGDLMAGTFKI